MQTPKTLVAMLTSSETYFVASKPRKSAKNEFFFYFFLRVNREGGRYLYGQNTNKYI